MLNIAVFVSGNGSNLQNLIDENIDIALVVSSNKNAYALKRSKDNNIATFIEGYEEESLIYSLKKKNIDLIVLAGYLKILPQSFFKEYRGKIINIHPSLLPLYGGMYGLNIHEEVIKNRDKYSGASVHYVIEEVDKGEIIEQVKIPVLKNDTPSSLEERIKNEVEKILLPKVVKDLCERKYDV